jgi:purine-nucleoside phosphorylase
MKTTDHSQIETAVAAIQAHIAYRPTIGLILGSGLNDLANAVENPQAIPFSQIPHWPASTVVGHSGRLLVGQLQGQTVLVQQGRAHFYEGYSPAQITFPVRVMRALGIETLIVTNAAGGINRAFTPGDLMLITDHLNFVGMAGANPLRGSNDDRLGNRFPDLTQAYDPALRALARATAVAQSLTLHQGVYAYVAGPSFETPAELRFLHAAGADAVGMSTVPEVIVARHGGMRVLGISSITNKAILEPQPDDEVSHKEVLEIGQLIVPRLTNLLYGILPQL